MDKTHTRQQRSRAGFTLIEVLVALAVLAMAMTALVQTGVLRLDNVNYLRDRTIAAWIASDRIVEVQTGLLPRGRNLQQGTVRMVDTRWRWELEIEPTEVDDILRLHAAVWRDDAEGRPLARIEGYADAR